MEVVDHSVVQTELQIKIAVKMVEKENIVVPMDKMSLDVHHQLK